MDLHRLAIRVASHQKFSGRSGDDWDRWLSHFELRFRDIPKAERVGVLIDLLDSSSLDCVAKLTPKTLLDYDAVTKVLGSSFGGEVNTLQAYAELGQIEQEPGEETEAFGDRVLKLVKKAYPDASSQQTQDNGLKQFICGLADRRLQEKLVAMGDLGSLEEALRVAKTYKKTTDALDAVRARKESGMVVTAQRQQPGSGADLPPSEGGEEAQTVAQMKKQLDQIQKALSELEARSRRSEALTKSPRAPRRCFQCGDTSHIKWQCPQLRDQIKQKRRDTSDPRSDQDGREAFCIGCGRKGHWLSQCWRVKEHKKAISDGDRIREGSTHQEN